jgi:hypothetical protein
MRRPYAKPFPASTKPWGRRGTARALPALLAAGALAAALGCAAAAREFTRPQGAELVLGKTTPAEAIARFGPPQQRGRAIQDGVEIATLSYSYADPEAPAAVAGVAAVKALALYFARDALVGYEFLSTFRRDSSDFDDTRVSDIARGATTEAEVRALVGQPSGMYIPPLIRGPGQRALLFLYGQKKGAAPLARKQLIVTVDAAGIVQEVQFEKSGDW